MNTSQIIAEQKATLMSVWICLFTLLFLACPAKTAEPAYARNKGDSPNVNELKAIYLYNFLKFVTWPEDSCKIHDGKPHRITVLGESPFNQVLLTLQEKLKENGKELQLTFYGPYRKDMQLDCCCLMFIAASEEENLSTILKELEDRPVLTVADLEAFEDKGIMITMVSQKNKIRWVVDRKPVNKSGLKLSSKLLEIAAKVIN